MDERTANYTYIGCVNGWPSEEITHPKYGKMMRTKDPELLAACKKEGHEHAGYSTRRGYHKTWCDTCKIWWDMDSGD